MTPLTTVDSWAAAWRRLDAGALSALFTEDATYVTALSGEVTKVGRAFLVAARVWRDCRIDDLDATLDAKGDGFAVVRATYMFSGTTIGGSTVEYPAAATFVLRADSGGPSNWRISRFHESHRVGSAPPIR